ncbi:MAG: hypothetical protein ABIA47_03590 [bacterium]
MSGIWLFDIWSSGFTKSSDSDKIDQALSKEANMDLNEAIASYDNRLRKLWGGPDYDALVELLPPLTRHWQPSVENALQQLDILRAHRCLVIVGERTFDEEQLAAANSSTLSILEYGANAHIVFSGGLKDHKGLGMFPAPMLYKLFLTKYPAYAETSLVDLDSLCQNTGHQALRIAFDAKMYGFRTFFLCLSIEHIARFAGVLAYALNMQGLPSCSIVPLRYGDWDEKVCDSNVTFFREAFGPPVVLDDDPEVFDGWIEKRAGQYGERWKNSLDKRADPSWLCSTLSPTELLKFIRSQPMKLA